MPDLEVTQLLALANSLHTSGADAMGAGPEHDHLAVPDEARSYLASEGLPVPETPPSAEELARLRQVRDLAHDITETPPERWREGLTDVTRQHVFRLGPDGEIVPAADGWDGFTASFLPQLFALRDQRERLRRCASPTCQWLFVDQSKNHSRVWCDMGTCGSRAKMTRYRSRRRKGDTAH